MTTPHASITNAEHHEPKDIGLANAGDYYRWVSSTSAEWQRLNYMSMQAPGGVPPAAHATVTAPVAYTAIGFTGFVEGYSRGRFTGSSAGPTITYVNGPTLLCRVAYMISCHHNGGGTKDIYVTLGKNGVALTQFEQVEEITTDYHHSFDDHVLVSLVAGDVLSIMVKVSTGNISVHNAYLQVIGVES